MKTSGCLLMSLVMLSGVAHAQTPGSPAIVAHRGLIRHAPENTLASFTACLELGVGFEFDVRRSKDGQLVCVHDATVQRTSAGKGAVADLTLAELKKLDVGSWFDPAFAGARVPTIEEILTLIKQRGRPGVLCAVDMKVADKEVPEEVVRTARKLGVLDRLIFIGLTITDADIRKRLRGADPKTPTAVLAQTAKDLDAALKAKDADWIYMRFVPTEEEVKRVHKAGKRVFLSGPPVMKREPANWMKAKELGVDGLLTDYPLECRLLWRGKK